MSSSSSQCLSSLLLLLLVLCFSGVSSADTVNPTIKDKGYSLISIKDTPDGGLLGLLQLKQESITYGPDIPLLQLYVKHETQDRLRVHITDAQKQRWEVPYNLLPREQPPSLKQTITPSGKTKNPIEHSEYSGSELIFSYISDPFGFAIKRKSDGQVLFNSSSESKDPYGELVFKDQYLEISTSLPKDAALYGLGENSQPHGIKLYPNDLYTLSSTGIALNHVPAGVKDASDKKILVDMLFWAVDNLAPANYLLISGGFRTPRCCSKKCMALDEPLSWRAPHFQPGNHLSLQILLVEGSWE